MTTFDISLKTQVISDQPADKVLRQAAQLLQRDIQKTVSEKGIENEIHLQKVQVDELTGDQFRVVTHADQLLIQGNTSLSVMYGALAVSRELLGIDDFWYFLDVAPSKKAKVTFDNQTLRMPSYHVKYRGWFVNDEVMISRWKDHDSTKYVWERIYETLLRLGGNIIIAGTDKNSHANRKSANEFGLMTAHHHAEPLGAQMFARVYPDLDPSYLKYPELFQTIWQESIMEQEGNKVVWSLGFRGQGDRPFWDDDDSHVWTEEEKAKVINDVIQLQYDMVKRVDPEAVCAVNIYGELTKMFNQKLLRLPEDVIEIWADNGFGKMVSRRQGNSDPRSEVLTSENPDNRERGIYYHVAFHDLQASNFLAKLPNSPAFVSEELEKVRQAKMDTLVVTNTGNIKPHILFLKEVAESWKSEYQARTNEEIFTEYLNYYHEDHAKIKAIYTQLFENMIQYGPHEDQKAGDEFYTYTIRKVVTSWLRQDKRLLEMEWLTGDKDLADQVQYLRELIAPYQQKWQQLQTDAQAIYLALHDPADKELFYNDILLDVIVHHQGLVALDHILTAFEASQKQQILSAFIHAYDGKRAIEAVLSSRDENPSLKWRDFYQNDVFTNMQLTKRMIDSLMDYLRVIGDGPEEYDWERNYLMDKGDSKVMLLSNTHDALTNDYLASKLHWMIEE